MPRRAQGGNKSMAPTCDIGHPVYRDPRVKFDASGQIRVGEFAEPDPARRFAVYPGHGGIQRVHPDHDGDKWYFRPETHSVKDGPYSYPFSTPEFATVAALATLDSMTKGEGDAT